MDEKMLLVTEILSWNKEPKVTLLLAKARGGFFNCHLIKNGGRGTKPALKFMVITPLMATKLKAAPNDNPTNDFIRGRNLFLSMFCNVTSPVGLLFFTVHI